MGNTIKNFVNELMMLDLPKKENLKLGYVFNDMFNTYLVYHDSKDFLINEKVGEIVEPLLVKFQDLDISLVYDPKEANILSNSFVISYMDDSEVLEKKFFMNLIISEIEYESDSNISDSIKYTSSIFNISKPITNNDVYTKSFKSEIKMEELQDKLELTTFQYGLAA